MRAIDADAMKAKIRPAEEYDTRCSVLISDVKKIFHEQIDNAPTITYEDLVPHGRWRINSNGDYFCSKCSERPSGDCYGGCVSHLSKYCPNCGAKMDGGKEK